MLDDAGDGEVGRPAACRHREHGAHPPVIRLRQAERRQQVGAAGERREGSAAAAGHQFQAAVARVGRAVEGGHPDHVAVDDGREEAEAGQPYPRVLADLGGDAARLGHRAVDQGVTDEEVADPDVAGGEASRHQDPGGHRRRDGGDQSGERQRGAVAAAPQAGLRDLGLRPDHPQHPCQETRQGRGQKRQAEHHREEQGDRTACDQPRAIPSHGRSLLAALSAMAPIIGTAGTAPISALVRGV